MGANWNLGEQFLGGASLAARIAGQLKQQGFQRQELEDQESTSSADSVARTGYTPDELNDPASGAGENIRANIGLASAAKNRLEGAQADYFSGRNSAYSTAAQARANAFASKAGNNPSALASVIKDYENKSMIDPDGSKGIYTPQMATEHAALISRFNTMSGIANPAADQNGTGTNGAAPKPGFFSGVGQGIGAAMSIPFGGMAGLAGAVGNYFGGAAAPAAPAPGAPAPAAAGGMIRVRNKQTGATGRMAANDPNIGAYEPIGQ